MRITLQLLWRHSQQPLDEVEHLNLSGNKISVIEQLQHCPSLRSLVLCNNRISVLQNLTSCNQLWSINLTGNRLKTLHGLSKFSVLGSLKLSCNELEWAELTRLCHMTLLSLTLSGNQQLDSDPNYREHVIDILPNVWSLDGRLITANERRDVAQFFTKSESSVQPVWRKACDRVFVPTFMKDLLITGIHGEKTAHMMSHFPVTYTHNTEMDRKRLHYLAHTFEENMKLHIRYNKQLNGVLVPELTKLLEGRERDTEQSNMLLLLLLAHCVYGLPHDLLIATLETAKLTKIGGVECGSLFNLPSEMMLDVASLLLAAVTIDREDKKEGGVYNKLFNSLNSTLDSEQRRIAAITAAKPIPVVCRKSPQKKQEDVQLCCLLASEVVHLLCLVPLFFKEITKHEGLLQLVCVATSNPHVGDIISSLTWKAQARGGSEWDMYEDIMTIILQSTSDIVQGKRRRGFSQRHHRNNSQRALHRTTSQQLLPSMKPHPAAPVKTRALSASQTSRKPHLHPTHPTHPHSAQPHLTHSTRPHLTHPHFTYHTHRPLSSHRLSSYPTSHQKQLELGDLVLLSSETTARIVSLPEGGVVVLQIMSSQSQLSVTPDSYFSTEIEGLVWDQYRGYWTRDDVNTDLSEIQLQSLSVDSVTVSRATTPDPIRPNSGMSMTSDFDLQTIPSESELDLKSESVTGEDGIENPPMRVDITDSRPPSRAIHTTKEARVEHQKKVLRRLSHDVPSPSPNVSPNPPPSPLSDTRDLNIPSPHVNLPEKWECSKSLPSSPSAHSTQTKQHSCQEQSPFPPPPSPIPPSHLSSLPRSISTISITHNQGRGERGAKPELDPLSLVRSTWSPVRSHAQPKQNLLSTTRLMNRREMCSPPTTACHVRHRATSAPAGHVRSDRVVGGGGTTTIILKPNTAKVYQSPPTHMTAYMTTAMKTTTKYHFNPQHYSHRGSSTRQLGDLKSLFVGGTSIT